MKIYPKVYHSNKKQTVFLQIEKAEEKITIKIQGMEYYTIPHSPLYRIDEEERYPFVEMKKCGDDLYSVEYEFRQEQKYSVTVMVGAEVRLAGNLRERYMDPCYDTDVPADRRCKVL